MPIKLKAAARLHADWWSDLDAKGQEQYISEHPASKKAKEAKEDETLKEPDVNQNSQAGDENKIKKQKPLAPGKPLSHYAASKDDPDVTAEKIYSAFSKEDVDEMKEKAKEAMSLETTDKTYVNQKGNYAPERLALHEDIIKSILSPEKIKAATPPPGTKPTFVVLGGRGGSGKSAFTHDEHSGKEPTVNEFDSRKYLVMDADAIKQLLDPPYEGWNANQVHEESSFLFDKIVDTAQKLGLNIVSDATLKSDKMGPVLEGLQKSGYDIEGHYMFLPRQKAAARACGRYLKDGKENRGRLVPPEVILGNTNNEANFDKLKPLFKKWSCYDNDQPKGSGPKLIDHSDYSKDTTAAPTKASVRVKAQSSKADEWENDPYLTSNDKRTEKVAKEAWANMRKLGIKPEQVRDPKERKIYTAYLETYNAHKA